MLFDSPVYLLFLLIVVTLYWKLNRNKQNVLLLAASYFFYGWWDWRFLLLMIFSTALDYKLAVVIADTPNARLRKLLFITSLVVNFGILGFFKYFNFFVDSFTSSLAILGITSLPKSVLAIILPPGISFYTFQEVAYIVDVYNKKQEPARSFIDYGLFISLFPHLIAGPIQRPSHLLPQVQNTRRFDPEHVFGGVMLILSGLFRKCFIADNCATLANAAFNGQLGHNVFSLIIGVYAFAWQIYGDFAGYSDMARGSAQLMGFHFMVNFRQPYFASNLQDFWHRWHISLSTWLRDYLYIPLGGNRKGNLRTYGNLMTTMLLGGLWHGANWTFVIWGGLQGVWLSVERLLFRDPSRIGGASQVYKGWIARVITLLVIGLSWVFFRAANLHDAVTMLAGISTVEWRPEYATSMGYLAAITSFGLLLDWRLEQHDEEYIFEKLHPAVPLGAALVLSLIVILFGAMENSAFIYFQF